MDLVSVTFEKACKLTRDDGSTVFFAAGTQAIEERDANHWYVKAHLAQTPPPALGDFEYARVLRAAADERKAAYEAADAQATAAELAFAEKQAAVRAASQIKQAAPPSVAAPAGGSDAPASPVPPPGAGEGATTPTALPDKPPVARRAPRKAIPA